MGGCFYQRTSERNDFRQTARKTELLSKNGTAKSWVICLIENVPASKQHNIRITKVDQRIPKIPPKATNQQISNLSFERKSGLRTACVEAQVRRALAPKLRDLRRAISILTWR